MEDEDLDGGMEMGDGGIEPNSISLEQIAELFGVQDMVGCDASYEQYTAWYNNLEIEQEVDLPAMFSNYQAVCNADALFYIPPSKKSNEDNMFRNIALIGGAALLYSAITKK